MIALYNNRTLYLISITLLCSSNFVACSTYKKNFGGTGQNYQEAQTTSSLQIANNKFPLVKNERYKIPDITIIENDQTTDILPPDYISPTPANNK